MTIQRAILTALERVHPGMLSEVVIFSDVESMLGSGVTLSGVRDDLRKLEIKRQVVSQAHEDRGTIWKITAEGKARLQE